MRRKPPARDPILLEVAAAIGAGRITIGQIDMGDEEHVHGITWSDGGIVINPTVETVDTAIHECLHRLRPTWTERTVRTRTRKLMGQLSNKDVECLFTLLVTRAAMKGKRRKGAA